MLTISFYSRSNEEKFLEESESADAYKVLERCFLPGRPDLTPARPRPLSIAAAADPSAARASPTAKHPGRYFDTSKFTRHNSFSRVVKSISLFQRLHPILGPPIDLK